MDMIVLEIDLGEKSGDARRFKREHPQMRLEDFPRVFPARFAADTRSGAKIMDAPLAEIVF